MPGLFGALHLRARPAGSLEDLGDRQGRALVRGDRHTPEAVVVDRRCLMGCWGRIGSAVPSRLARSADGSKAMALDGELHNARELADTRLGGTVVPECDAALALALWQEEGWSWLPRARGSCVLVLYDGERKRLELVTDRHGHRYLFAHRNREGIVFGSAVEAVLEGEAVPRRLDPRAVREFFCFGYLLQDRTWMEGVTLLPAGSVCAFSEEGWSTRRWWSREDLPRLDRPESFEEAVDHLGDLWRQAVERQADARSLGLTLSGGLDSRSVLAAVPEDAPLVEAVTFGHPRCQDVRIARRAARVRGVPHTVVPITADNWMDGREEAVAWTDGHLNLLHAHVASILPGLGRRFEVNLHSLAGDLILGGSYLYPEFLDTDPESAATAVHAKMRLANEIFPRDDQLDRVREILAEHPTTDSFFLAQRVRRFTVCGCRLLETEVRDRKPSFDPDLLAFCAALPDRWRYAGRIYHAMLLRRYPEYFAHIPWQQTGAPITAGKWRRRWNHHRIMTQIHLERLAWKAGWPLPFRRDYANYLFLTTRAPAADRIRERLLDPGARWRSHLPEDRVVSMVEGHLDRRMVRTEDVLALLTLEIWLHRVRA